MNDQVYEILGKLFSGKGVSSSEKETLENWKNLPNNDLLYKEVEKAWELTGELNFPEEPDLDQEWNNFVQLKNESEPVKEFRSKKTFLVAASVAILLGIFSSVFFFELDQEIQIASKNEVLEHILPDNSKVILRENTTISYSEKFGTADRDLLLDGEAFFDVERNEILPFVINTTNNIKTTVLGTSFNLKATKDSDFVELQVVSGKVSFGNENKSDVFTRNQSAVFNLNKQSLIENPANENNMAWRTHKLMFNNDNLDAVAEALSNYFKCKVVIPSEIKMEKFSGSFTQPSVDDVSMIIATTFNCSYQVSEKSIVFVKE